MKKILYVATVVKTHIMEFHIPYLKMLKEEGWQTSVAARNDYENPADCVIPYCDFYYDVPFARNPVKADNLTAYKKLKKIIDEGNYDIIHCHTPAGALITRLAAEGARKRGTKVFYTAHGFHFFKGAPLQNWLLYYPPEKLLARKTDVLITINTEDYRLAQKFKAGKTEYIPGIGVSIEKFSADTGNRLEKRRQLGIAADVKVLLSVGEVNRNKNHRAVIEVLPQLENCIYVICGTGPLMDEYTSLAERLGVGERLILAGYRTDVAEFYHMADVFVFPSFREGLPVALMEAMAAGLPCVAARNRGTNDLLPESRLRFDANDRNELTAVLRKALAEDCTDEIQRNQKMLKKFDLANTLALVKKFYSEAIK